MHHPIYCWQRETDLQADMCSLSVGSSTLKRAKLHGPSAYACLSLAPSGKGKAAAGLPSMTTAAQQPSFCPAFLARQIHDVVLDCQGMKALALQVQRAVYSNAKIILHSCTWQKLLV